MRYLIASLQNGDDERTLPSRLGFTSALEGEGVTFIAKTVAAVLAHDSRQRVCLVDLNWGGAIPGAGDGRSRRRSRRGQDGEQPEPAPGLADALRREVPFRDIILDTEDPYLTVVTAGVATAAEGQVFARSERLSQILGVLERENDHLILDLPPVLASSAAIPLARQAGTVGVVVRHGVTTEGQVRTTFERLGQIPSLGVVLNRASSRIPRPLLRRLSNW